MPNFSLGVTISAIDKISKPISFINSKIKSITRPVKAVQNRFRSFARETRIPELIGRVSALKGSFGKLTTKASFMAKRTVLAFGAIAGGAFAAINKITSLGDNTAKTADRMGVSVSQFERWRFAAERSGVSVSEFSTSIRQMQRSVVMAAKDKKSSAAGIFKGLGIALKDSNGVLKSTPVLLGEFADAISGVSNKVTRNAVLMEVMGRSGTQMATLLQGGSKGITSLGDEAERVGAVLGNKFARDSEKFQDRLTNITSSVKGLTGSLLADLLPGINKNIMGMSNWIAANRGLIKGKIKEFVSGAAETFKMFGNAVSSVTKLIAGKLNISITDNNGKLKSTISIVGGVIDKLGGLKAIGSFVATAIGVKLALSVLSLGMAFGSVVKDLFLFGGSLIRTTLKIGSFIPSILKAGVNVIWFAKQMAVFAVTKLVQGLSFASTAVSSFGAALLANPIGLFIAGIAAVAGAAFLIVRYWEPISGFFSKLWAGISSSFSSGFNFISGFLGNILSTFNNWLSSLIGFDLFAVGSKLLSGLLGGLVTGWNIVSGFLSSIITSFGSFVSDIFGFDLFDAGANLLNGLWDGMKSTWNSVTSWLGSAVDSLTSLLPDSIKDFLGIGGKTSIDVGLKGGLSTGKLESISPTRVPLLRTSKEIPLPGNKNQDKNTVRALSPRFRRRENAGRQQFTGNIVVDFRNAPRGTRVTQIKSSGNADIDIDAGLSFAIP